MLFGMRRCRMNLPNRCYHLISRVAHRAFEGGQAANRKGCDTMTRKTYCGNLLWQSSLTLLAHWNITAEANCWQKQETHKGVEPVAGNLKGGWGFYWWMESNGEEEYPVYYSAATANAMVANGSITNNPVFYYPGTQMDNRNATQDDIWFALAEYVPAISSPVGGNSTAPEQLENHDLNGASYRNGWGRSHKTYLDKWFHSDMKDMAYYYVYPLYDELKTKGNLK